MENQNQQLLVLMPSDDELCQEFIIAIRDWVHENIKGVAKSLSWYIEKAKDEIKNIVNIDQQNWLYLDITVSKWDIILESFVSKQGLLTRNALKILLSTVWARTFSNFIVKMNNDPESKDVTINTLSNIMTIFFVNLGKKYLTNENEVSIKEKISNLFI